MPAPCGTLPIALPRSRQLLGHPWAPGMLGGRWRDLPGHPQPGRMRGRGCALGPRRCGA